MTSFHHQSEAQHPKSSAIHKHAGRLPHLMTHNGRHLAGEFITSVGFWPFTTWRTDFLKPRSDWVGEFDGLRHLLATPVEDYGRFGQVLRGSPGK